MKRSIGVGLAVLCLVSQAAWAGDGVVDIESGAFERQRAAVLADMAGGEAYAEISPRDRQTVVSLLDRMQGVIGDASSVEALHETERVRLFNDQEQVNTILTRAKADSRLICRRETPIGSRRPQTSCMTVAERRRATETSQERLRARGVMKPTEPR
ncbi:hypothetical protein [Luteimonas sp. FCS-9]|uniref:hypothetical protein n=1 Tax=Luteimonas sp. FCS-9 TaxID=1547516 RepID=UPI00063E84CA|nr:hypothetical protein [Luteimonas sp. FCS-9]KLJ00997.1 hypothetical protein WQ56_07065 [Luteimonas sp. FCS-9]